MKNKFGQLVYNELDLCNLVMKGQNVQALQNLTIDPEVSVQTLQSLLDDFDAVKTWNMPCDDSMTQAEFDHQRQQQWFMPDHYLQIDIAEHVLGLCHTEQELQRVGQELLMFQERNLFDLLRWLKYLVDTMTQNNIIWGVGRGSSVASYVLYLLGVHKIDSIYYDLDPQEFLR
jgi:DNA polymerase III alpha subunit